MKLSVLKSLATAMVLGLALSSVAGAGGAESKKLPEVLKAAQASGGMTVVSDFAGPSGLQGWVVKEKAQGKDLVVFTTADGQTLIAGMLIDKVGANLTAKLSEEHIAPPDYSAAYAAFTKEATSTFVGSPKAKAEITVVLDMNCGYCKLLHQLVAPAIEAGDLRVRYVPVAILGADSGPKGAALLASTEAKGMLDTAATNGKVEGSTNQALLAKVQANTALMKKYGFNGTPAVLYQTANKEHTLVVATGLPNIQQMFEQLGVNGHLDQLKANPALAKYIQP